MADTNLLTMLQDISLMDDRALEHYHAAVVKLIKANNASIKQEVVDEVNSNIGGTVSSDINAKVDKVRTELTESLTNYTDTELKVLEELLTNMIEAKQDKIVGSEGQSITFDKDGNIIAIDGKPGGSSGGSGSFGLYTQHFQDTDWDSNDEIRIPESKHNLTPSTTETCFTVYGVNGHNIRDYTTDTDLNEFKADVVAMYQAAIAANNTTPGTYPTDNNGYIIFTWEQLQVYILEDTLLTADDAAQKVVELNINWKDTKTLNVEPTTTLADYLNAAYMPALNGPAVQFNAMSTLQNVQGWRFRRTIVKDGVVEPGAAGKYDIVGKFVYTWGAVSCCVHYDPVTKDLVVHSNIANPDFEGFVIVMSDT